MSHVLLLQYLLYLDLIGTGACTITTDHCLAMKSGSQLRPYNRVCNSAEITNLDVENIKQFFGATPFTWVVDAHDEGTIAVLQKQGLCKVAEFPAMKSDITKIPTHSHTPKLVISEAQHPAEVASWIQCTASIYNYSIAEFDHAISYIRRAGDHAVKLYSGWYDGKRVCTGMAIYHDHVVTLHVIGTIPEYRNRGFGYDFTYQLLHMAASTGCTHAILIATPAGTSIYNRCGFIPYATYCFYAPTC